MLHLHHLLWNTYIKKPRAGAIPSFFQLPDFREMVSFYMGK